MFLAKFTVHLEHSSSANRVNAVNCRNPGTFKFTDSSTKNMFVQWIKNLKDGSSYVKLIDVHFILLSQHFDRGYSPWLERGLSIYVGTFPSLPSSLSHSFSRFRFKAVTNAIKFHGSRFESFGRAIIFLAVSEFERR